jgi:hypothetical protein
MRGVEWMTLEEESRDDVDKRKRRRVKGKEGDIYITSS